MEALPFETTAEPSNGGDLKQEKESLISRRNGNPSSREEEERIDRSRRIFHLSICITAFLLLLSTVVFLLVFSARDGGVGTMKKRSNGKSRVLLVSLDAFRWDYVFRSNAKASHLRRMVQEGIRAEWMQPVYPSKTFPNHWSMVTGLLPAWHGIVGNRFLYDNFTRSFVPGNQDPNAWRGDPIWATAKRQGKRAMVVFWPGSDVSLGGWECIPDWCKAYDGQVNDTLRARMALDWLTQEHDEMPDFVALYQETTDDVGHMYGPNTPEMTAAIEEVDANLGIVIDGLERHGTLDEWDIVIVSDHGMTSTCAGRFIYIDELSGYSNLSQWIDGDQGPLMMLDPPSEEVLELLHTSLTQAQKEQGLPFKVYKKNELPRHLGELGASKRIPSLLVLPDEGYQVVTRDVAQKHDANCDCRGNHGWDNRIQDMMATFIARGPHFKPGAVIEPFLDINVYELVSTLLHINASPNNGSASWARSITGMD